MAAARKRSTSKRAPPRKAKRAPAAKAQARAKAATTVITFGTFDLFHVGHLRMLERARALGSRLVVGVSSDGLNVSKKQKTPVFTQAERLEIIAGLRCVDAVFLEESLEQKADYVRRHKAQVLVMGDDWAGKFDWVGAETGCKVVYLTRTPAISTTALVEKIQG